ncbi:hypothetical protein B0H19DRAFT_1183022 [Mycena capillaripes]|nr:hypothetical protein B0H19DRAFT_1183022 [Mycena capillaripes]
MSPCPPLSRLARPPSAGGYTTRPFRAVPHRATPRFATAPVGKPYSKVFMSRESIGRGLGS